MSLERVIARTFAMTDEVWARHANPWSVWTRFSILPFLVASIWSRVWIGWWAVLPSAMVIIWTWLNPRLFPRPRSPDNWASKAVLGKRVWLNRDKIPAPRHHRVAPHVLSGDAGLGTIVLVWGLIDLAVWPTLLGMVLVYCG